MTGRPKKEARKSSELDGLKLKAVREHLGLTQEQMGALIGWSKEKQARLERNESRAKISDVEIREAVKTICQRHEELNLSYDHFDSNVGIENFRHLITKKKEGTYPYSRHTLTENIRTGTICRHKDIEQLHNISSEMSSQELNMTSIDSYSRYHLFVSTIEKIKHSFYYDNIVWYPDVWNNKTNGNKQNNTITYNIEELYNKIIVSYKLNPSNNSLSVEDQKQIVIDLLCKNRTILIIYGIRAIRNNDIDHFLHTLPPPSKAIIIDTKKNIIAYICHQIITKMARYANQHRFDKKQKLVDVNNEILSWAMDDLNKMDMFKKYQFLYSGVKFPKGHYEEIEDML